METKTTEPWVFALLIVWVVLFVPWAPFALLSGMAFDAGPSIHAYVFFWSLWTYPFVVLTAVLLRRKVPMLVILPCLNFIAFLISGRY
jgi:hypothetical protein